ncbi:cation acetate symporter [Paeniglutamicibacter kerguelensis]|uniref:Na+(H+)/acetate symporter ActP n=1 Tax=Paeniglutamicibacter kerguelensis TaxID=254788 RepID=A0ABS4XA23_9MICC|nr:cation acetate symporter [Paeniglutamicibacter kerguelensis]MBP2385103.1 Na+(H+)/acetate symporter ActP [Paeniglutamicibacter kerguelensis]
MNSTVSLIAVALVSVVTVTIAINGLRLSRTTGDFYVASRTVRPWWNASAIGGEYLSAASFLGIAGLIVVSGQDALWFPIGYTAGYLMLLLFVAAPLRRSRAYTIPDFAQIRFGSRGLRRLTSFLVVVICWLYIVPQLHGAALTLGISTGLPGWLGSLLVMGIVCVTVLAGGMRSITFVQAFQYWLKLAALAIPVVFMLLHLDLAGESATLNGAIFDQAAQNGAAKGLYYNISLLVALLFGTLGLPHVLVRFYTNPDGPSARKTTAIVLGLLSLFYLFPTVLGILGRAYTPELANSGNADATVLLLPGRIIGGAAGDALTAIIIGGAFAAFLSTSSGLVVSLAGTISQDLFRGTVRGFRISTVIATAVPLLLALGTSSFALAGAVGSVFAFTASTVCPLLLLGIWWRGLTVVGAVSGLFAGAFSCGLALLLATLMPNEPGSLHDLVSQPAAWTVPLAFIVMVGVSIGTKDRIPARVDAVLARLHVPEQLHNPAP